MRFLFLYAKFTHTLRKFCRQKTKILHLRTEFYRTAELDFKNWYKAGKSMKEEVYEIQKRNWRSRRRVREQNT